MQKQYEILDVFTKQSMAGNQLAVVYDADDLNTNQMQKIAREFNFSETIFIQSSDDENNLAKLRIFIPTDEIPFAGHPTVGGAIALAKANNISQGEFILEEKIGLVHCGIDINNKTNYAEFRIPKLSEIYHENHDLVRISQSLNLQKNDIGFDNHFPLICSAGMEFFAIPIATQAALNKIVLNKDLWKEILEKYIDENSQWILPLYAYTKISKNKFDVRMMAPHSGIDEDPATGAAAAAFSGVVEKFESLNEGENFIEISQGIKMERPSFINLKLDIENSKIRSAKIGGYVSTFAKGTLEI